MLAKAGRASFWRQMFSGFPQFFCWIKPRRLLVHPQVVLAPTSYSRVQEVQSR